jgi:hypothetical protein
VLQALADHLWQSLLFCSLCASLAWLVRGNSAWVRLWMWRICAIKLVLPFALLFALGRWIGFPAYHSADRVPAPLLHLADALTPLLAPVQSAQPGPRATALWVLAALPAIWLCVLKVRRGLGIEQWLAHDESSRRAADPDDAPPGLGFFKGALLALCVISIVGGVLLGGAIAERRWRLELLAAHARALRGAEITLNEAAPGMGRRSRIDVRPDGVLIRNINVQDLVALAYGVNHYAVWGNQMMYEDDPDAKSWLVDSHYDLRIRARIAAPEDFDPYALRPRITQFLADRFGFEIYINGKCQPPCGAYNVPVPEEFP